jgi:hypothetical protein
MFSVFGAFAALLLVSNSISGIAFAQDAAGVSAPPSQLLDHAVAPAGLQPGGGFPENPFARPRFVVNAVHMRAIDETGPDWWGDDDIVVNFESNRGEVTTGVYGDMDTGDIQGFRPANRCMAPLTDPDGKLNNAWACGFGSGAPLEVIISLHEHDDWDLPAEFCGVVDGQNDLQGDCELLEDSSFFGSQRIVFTESELIGAMPIVGGTYTETAEVDPCAWYESCGAFTPGIPGYGRYSIEYQLTRVSDQIIGHTPVAPQ